MAYSSQSARSQDMKNQLQRGHEMLAEIKRDIKEHYFDPNFRGIKLESHFEEADSQIANATTGDQIYGIIARTLLAFDDTHTYYIPPLWSMGVDYGWEMQMFGDECYVTSVKTGSDADIKGSGQAIVYSPSSMYLSIGKTSGKSSICSTGCAR